MKKQKEEAEKYTGLQERRKGLQQRASLLKLFSIEREVASLLQERQAIDADFEAASGRQRAAEDEVNGLPSPSPSPSPEHEPEPSTRTLNPNPNPNPNP